MPLDAQTAAFWQAYLATVPDAHDAVRRFYEVFRIGESSEAADVGARLIVQGVKTATSSLLWTYQATGKPLPAVGALSIVTDGRGAPVCIIETISVAIQGFADVDAAFAYAYGEWDRTLETWRAHCWEVNAPRCYALGKVPSPAMPLVCERFTVVYPAPCSRHAVP
jgi:uncharacterized protein YhfF